MFSKSFKSDIALTSPSGIVANSSTGATQIPVGTTAQRPVSPLPGTCRWNTSIASAEIWTGSTWYQYAQLTDPYFNNNVLLLNADAQTWLTDASSNKFLLTPSGTPTPSTFTPYQDSYYSNLFNGTSSYLTVPDSASLQLGTGDFTIEAWTYVTTASTSRGIVCKGPGAATTGWECKFNSANFFRFEWTASFLVGSTVIPTNTWTHVAVVRSGTATGNVKLYVNGALYATSGVAVTDNFTQTDNLRVGIDRVGTGFFPGNISNLRIVKGTAVYTGAFTPSTSPLTLTQTSAPVTPTVDYLVVAGGGGGGQIIGGGGGAGGYLTATGFAVAANTSLTVTIGAAGAAGNGTIGGNGGNSVFSSITATGGGGGGVWAGNAGAAGGSGGGGAGSDSGYGLGGAGTSLQGNAGGNGNNGGGARLAGGGGGAGSVGGAAAGGLPGNGGSGLATSISGTATYYASGGGGGKDGSGGGTSVTGGGGAANVSGTANTGGGGGGGGNPTVAGSGGSGIVIVRYLNTYSLAAVTTGSPTFANIGGYYIYTWTQSGTITFNPTIAILSGTSLLTCQSNRFLDNSSNKLAITTTGAPSISQNQPFAVSNTYLQNGSGYFNGSTDYLQPPTNAALTFGSGASVSAMTAEAWFYTTTASTDQTVVSQYASGSSGWAIRLNTSVLRAQLTGDTTPITGTTTLIANTWYHAALSGSVGSWKLFLNGVQEGATQTGSVTLGDGAPIQIGRLSNVTYFNGYISNVRITKGTALYTTTFTPSVTPLTATTNITALSAPPSAEILVVAGGGGGRDVSGNIAGIRDSAGGGAGGIIWNSAANLVAGVSYPIVIGAGGASATNGSNSTWNSSFDAIGGGAGGQVSIAGSAGGSGGGGANYLSAAGASNKVTYTGWTSYGNAGGAGLDTGPAWGAGGGGGAGAAGTAGTSTTGGTGGVGVSLTTGVSDTGYPAALFSGSNYLSAPSSAAFAYGTGDFTIEMWVYPTSASWTSGNYYFYGDTGPVGTLQYYQNQLSYYNAAVGAGGVLYNSGGVIVASTWSHIAISRQSGTTRMFINGRLITSASDTQNYSASNGVQIAAAGNSTGIFGGGYLSNVRIVKGVAVYTGAFTVPTSPLTVTQSAGFLAATAPPTVDYLVVAGGGGGGAIAGGGGGGGGYLTATGFAVATNTSLTVTVGTGGTGSTGTAIKGINGANSVFSTITAIGGGGGGSNTNQTGSSGGSGGGESGTGAAVTSAASGTVGQGNNGGLHSSGGPSYGSGGGGGAATIGATGTTSAGGAGGAGASNSISGIATYYAGGGGGSVFNSVGSLGLGGLGGGGNATNAIGTVGTTNTGGGGGGGGYTAGNGGSGGSGIVIIRYLASYSPAAFTTGNPTVTLSGAYRVYTFTTVGTWSITFGDSNIAAITGTATSLLTCRSSTFVDISSNAFAITATGTPTMQPLVSPFAYTYYAGGGGGGAANSAIAAGGTGGGGASTASAIGGAGTANTGGGGGGVGNITGVTYAGGTGGSGVAIIKYPDTYAPPYQVTGDPTILLSNGYRIYTWATSGSIIFDPTPTVATTVANTSLLTLQTKLPTNNNTFLDSSPNNFAITRTGTPTQGTFTPFSQTGWSGYFNGSSDYLSVPSNAALIFGSNDFTIESWVYLSAVTAAGSWIYSRTLSSGVGTNFFIYNSYLNGQYSTNGTSNTSIIGTTAIPLNTWNHVAYTRSSSTLTLWLNGVSQITAAISGTLHDSGTSATIGTAYPGVIYGPLAGYISNLRIVKGAAVYTANFTPSTTPLTTLSGLTLSTSLLTLQNNRFKDNSTTAFAITTSGTPSIQAISPFAPTAAYSTSLVGGSGYFNGSTDYLGIANTAAIQLTTGSFTIECWIYCVGSTGNNQVFLSKWNGSGYLIFLNATTYYPSFQCTAFTITSTVAVSLNVWTHIAVVCNSTTYTLYVNGVAGVSTTNASTNADSGGVLDIGINSGNGANAYYGYISNLRIVKGTAVYTAAFTPPTAPLTSIVNTSLLLSATNAGIYDTTGKNDVTTVGSVTVSTSVVKYGTGALYFNGTTDYLTTLYNPNLTFGTGNFTIECWINLTTTATTQRRIIGLGDGANGSGPVNCSWELKFLGSDGSNQISFYRYDGTEYVYTTVGATINAGQWYHIAVVRNSGTLAIYVNGTAYYSAANSLNFTLYNTNNFYVGLAYYGPAAGYGGPRYFGGYIDDVRITNGIARYRANFIPPVVAFTNK